MVQMRQPTSDPKNLLGGLHRRLNKVGPLQLGTLSPNPWDLSLSRQNGISASGAANAAPSHSGN
jgi:hypothetical protein